MVKTVISNAIKLENKINKGILKWEHLIPYILLLVIIVDISLDFEDILFMHHNGLIATIFQPIFLLVFFIIIPLKKVGWFIIYNLIVLFFTYYSYKYGKKHNRKFVILAWSSLIFTYISNFILRFSEVSFFWDYYNVFYFISFLICLGGFETYFRRNKIKFETIFNIFKIIVIYIGFIFLISYITGTVIESYEASNKIGFSGWFVSSNSIGHLLTIIFPIILYNFLKDKSFINFGVLIISILCQLAIGTKAPYLGIMLTLFIFLGITIFGCFKDNKFNKINIGILIVIILVMISIFPITPLSYNLKVTGENEEIDLLSGRYDFLTNKTNFSSNENNCFGFLFILTGNNSYLNSKLIEIDYFDIFFNNGLYGIIVFIIITGYYLRLISKKIIKKSVKNFSLKNIAYIIPVCLILGIAGIAGHIFVGSYITIYSAFMIILLLYNLGGIKYEKQ